MANCIFCWYKDFGIHCFLLIFFAGKTSWWFALCENLPQKSKKNFMVVPRWQSVICFIVFSGIPGKSWLFPWFPNSQEILTIPGISQFPGNFDYSQEWKKKTVKNQDCYSQYQLPIFFFRIESLVFMNKENFLTIKHPIWLN